MLGFGLYNRENSYDMFRSTIKMLGNKVYLLDESTTDKLGTPSLYYVVRDDEVTELSFKGKCDIFVNKSIINNND